MDIDALLDADPEFLLLEQERQLALEEDKWLFYATHAYDWQKAFHNADAKERLLMAANGVGKTICGAFETACHLLGKYPDWWEGHRWDRGVKVWAGSITNETQRDYVQPHLLGDDLEESLGKGFIPKDAIIGKVRTRQAGMSGVVDGIRVRHISGGVSRLTFKTYEQGWRKWQGAAPDIIWADEQPDENSANEADIFTEMQTRVFRSGGIILMTLTPLLGETNMIRHFTQPKHKGIWWIGATWDDAPHLNDEDKERLKATYADHQVEARTLGIPMMGEGRIFPAAEDSIKVDPFEIPSHYHVIKGVDFGVDHPAAVAEIAIDRDRDIWFVTRVWRQDGVNIATHAAAINAGGRDTPVAWPHDGMNRKDVGTNRMPTQLWQIYTQEYNCNMLPVSARYETDKGGAQAQWPIIEEIKERIATGRFKVFSSCPEFFDEYRSYHIKKGVIVPIRDDVLKAVFYAGMMQRYAHPRVMPVYDTNDFGVGISVAI